MNVTMPAHVAGVLDRFAHSIGVKRRTAAMARDLPLHQLADGDADGR
jgi:hypothetical protein